MPSMVGYLIVLALISGTAAYDPDALQDICVASSSGPKVNGFVCKSEANVTAEDFSFDGLAKPVPKYDKLGFSAVIADADSMPGLNTLGMAIARAQFAPGGLVHPHTHPRATELVFVLEGELLAGFITTGNKLISKTIKKGEVFVIPRGLVHFQINNGDKPASLIATFNSQLPGAQLIAPTLFTATPAVPDDVLTKAFQVDAKVIDKIKSNLAPKKS